MLKIFNKIQRLKSFDILSGISRPFSSQKKTGVESLATEPKDDLYETYLKDEFTRLYVPGYQNRISGSATTKETKYYSLRTDIPSENHFRKPYKDDLTISSVGIGTYVGSPDEIDDLKMFNAIVESVISGGVNVFDTAINYRYQKSERVVGAALRYLLEKGYQREEFFICSKNGYIPEDADRGVSSQFLIDKLVQGGKMTADDVVGGCHSMHPAFLEDQLEASLTNIGVETLDLYYLHNAAESQMPLIGHTKFMDKLAKSFEFCEKKVQEKKIKSYGLATWVCFRAKPEEENLYLKIQEVADLAKKVGGDKHNFKYIQLPVNLAMPEAFAEKWQTYNDNGKIYNENVFQVARRCRLNVITSSPLAQGLMMQVPLSTDIFKCTNLGAKHLQFARSLPAEALLTTLIGQKTARHVKKNLEVVQYPPLPIEEFMEFLKPTKRVGKAEEAVDMDD